MSPPPDLRAQGPMSTVQGSSGVGRVSAEGSGVCMAGSVLLFGPQASLPALQLPLPGVAPGGPGSKPPCHLAAEQASWASVSSARHGGGGAHFRNVESGLRICVGVLSLLPPQPAPIRLWLKSPAQEYCLNCGL